MNTLSTWISTRASRRTQGIAASATLFALAVLVVALPAVPAEASAMRPTPSVAPPVEVSGLPSGEVEKLLAGIPLEDLNATQLSELLAQLPGFSALPAGPLQEAFTKTIEGLAGDGDTLGQLSDTGELASKLETQLKSLLSPTELLSLLKGGNLTTLLTGALGSPKPGELLNGLLGSATSPEQLIQQVLADVNPSKLEALLGTTLAGEPFTKTTAGELASSLGTTDQGFTEALDTNTSQLPASAMALTAPLTNGKTLGVLSDVEGLTMATLGGGSGGSGSSGGSGGSGSSGGSGGPGGASGSSGGAGGTTVVVNNLPAQAATASAAGARAALAKIKVIRQQVRGNDVTVVVQVPGAGRLTVSGNEVRSVSKQTSTAERVTLRTALTRAGIASRRAHRRDIKVKLKTTFTPVDGAASSTTSTITFG